MLMAMIKNIIESEITFIILENIEVHNICHLRYDTSKEISLVFHNGSKYDYHFIIEKLVEKSEE